MAQADIDTVYKLHMDFVEAMKGENTEFLVNSFEADGMMMPPGEPSAVGADAIRAYFTNFFDNFTTEKAVPRNETYLDGGDDIIETGDFEWVLTPKAGGESTETMAKWVAVWHRQPDGSWKAVRDIFNSNA